MKLAAVPEAVLHKADYRKFEALASGLEALGPQAPNAQNNIVACIERIHALELGRANLALQPTQARGDSIDQVKGSKTRKAP